MKTVSIHTTGIEAHIVRCRLEYEGIPAFVAFEHHVWAVWIYSTALGGVRVQVPEAYFESSKVIVKKISLGEYKTELSASELKPDVLRCPKCNSEQIKAINWPWKASLVTSLLFIPLSLPLPYTRHLKKCEPCSNTWVANEQRGVPLSVIFLTILAIMGSLFAALQLWGNWCRLNCENPYIYDYFYQHLYLL